MDGIIILILIMVTDGVHLTAITAVTTMDIIMVTGMDITTDRATTTTVMTTTHTTMAIVIQVWAEAQVEEGQAAAVIPASESVMSRPLPVAE